MRYCIQKIRSFAFGAALLLGVVGAGVGTATASTPIVVNGISYNAVELNTPAPAPGITFNDPGIASRIVGLVPWWGNSTFAEQAATTFNANKVGALAGITYAFVFSIGSSVIPGTDPAETVVNFFFRQVLNGVTTTGVQSASVDTLRTDIIFVAIPEIDGPVLAQMALVLSVLCIGLVVIRRRPEGNVAGA